jgi:hypothetical protein
LTLLLSRRANFFEQNHSLPHTQDRTMLALWLVLLLALSSAVHAETGIASHYSSKDRDQNGSKTVRTPLAR